jgi:hypothetical protein
MFQSSCLVIFLVTSKGILPHCGFKSSLDDDKIFQNNFLGEKEKISRVGFVEHDFIAIYLITSID